MKEGYGSEGELKGEVGWREGGREDGLVKRVRKHMDISVERGW